MRNLLKYFDDWKALVIIASSLIFNCQRGSITKEECYRERDSVLLQSLLVPMTDAERKKETILIFANFEICAEENKHVKELFPQKN